ncbi:MAG: class I SAM-dependent methyltransferase [Betaproteobacteria bacterium]|nr:class I SAM-dependent methyltransferase [Betaproteobacteria bacterium]
MTTPNYTFTWAEQLSPRLLKSPWWIGHIPFAYELIGRLHPRTIVELGTYSGSSFAAFCQAMQAAGVDGKCYGVDLWEGDIHMGRFDESLFEEVRGYMQREYPMHAVLIRKDFNSAADDFNAGSIDLLHIDGTHTYEAVSNDFNTWLPKMSSRGVVLFHDTNVTVEKAGEAALRFGVRRLFDEVKASYTHFEFDHCWGLGVLLVGSEVSEPVRELIQPDDPATIKAYFAAKGEVVSRQFEALGVELPKHGEYSQSHSNQGETAPWRQRLGRLAESARRLFA